MENEIIKQIAELLGNETGVETEKVYNYIQNGLKKKEEEKIQKEEQKETQTVEDVVNIMNKAYEKSSKRIREN